MGCTDDRAARRAPALDGEETVVEKAMKFVVLAIIAVMVIYPFITVVATSLATQEEITRKGGLIVLWPSSRVWAHTSRSSPADRDPRDDGQHRHHDGGNC